MNNDTILEELERLLTEVYNGSRDAIWMVGLSQEQMKDKKLINKLRKQVEKKRIKEAQL